MLTRLLFPEVPGLQVDRVWQENQSVHIAAHPVRRAARCPLCHRRSKRVRSAYERTLADLPCCGQRVVVHLHTRRFACRVPWCPRRVFAEQVPALTLPHARRTVRLSTRLEQTGFDLGGAAGARHARAEGMPVSGRTLLRPASRPAGAAGRPGRSADHAASCGERTLKPSLQY